MNAPHPLPSPYEAPELYDRLFDRFDVDLAFWLAEARAARGPVLELACGTGRVLLRLLEAGIDADGVDASAPMLDRLRAKAAERRLVARVHVADMRDFTMPRRYARVICPFNAFAHAVSPADQIATLRCCREHLEAGGALVLHQTYPGVAYWSGEEGVPVLEVEAVDDATGQRLQLWDTRRRDRVGQLQRSEMEVRVLDREGRTLASHRSATTLRWVYRFELEHLFRIAGFPRWEVRGGFEREPLERDDQQMLAWAWKD